MTADIQTDRLPVDGFCPKFDINLQRKSVLKFSLAILASRLEAALGLFWDGSRNFEPLSDEEDDTGAGTPLQNSAPHHRFSVHPYGL
ncbi:hypothetical protein AVEN_201351-1 [Araneus ventricosus]|uniref:Uncharacterized protein n=1 Tax=Araneus ventricosus TaxID=182803 RepID=A0A4Y2SGZ9_ARAVE|nr:hypothetical protein AVEN_114099-1 [Araneus ventricosus]GBN87502.1 hypothetical protein AVEN_201351-1 [Araneus ventricosus]